ncbi:MAG: polysulfide reductase NrfD [Bacteroidia bacterium]|nr:polysulfide reductase NrfD [Bacteroidia bacterium]
MTQHKIHYENAVSDLLRPIYPNRSFKRWMAFLIISLIVSIVAYYFQIKDGLGVTGLGDYVSWGMYIANFVFFVATSLVGMLISAVLGLTGVKWATPLTRIAEIIALAFAMVAGLVIIVDMGRPERLLNVLIYGRVQSPILWDVTVVSVYVIISALLLYIPLIPDMKICSERLEKAPAILRKLYNFLSLGWTGSEEQAKIIRSCIRILSILIIPVALSIHTVTSWLFAATLRSGWDSTILGPYFVTGAFVAGCAAVNIAMYFYRRNYNLKEYITDFHFDKMGKLLVLVSLVYLYFNINEFLVPAYKMKTADAIHLHSLFTGRYAILFWSTQVLGLVLPIILLLFKKMRTPGFLLIISIFVLVGSWLKRYLIVVPTMEHPFLPIQNVPEEFKFYTPTLTEGIITFGTIILALLIITILSKLFPVIPIWEITQKHESIDD